MKWIPPLLLLIALLLAGICLQLHRLRPLTYGDFADAPDHAQQEALRRAAPVTIPLEPAGAVEPPPSRVQVVNELPLDVRVSP